MGARVLDLRFKAAAGRHQRFHPLHDGGLLGEGWERDKYVSDSASLYLADRLVGMRQIEFPAAYYAASTK